MITGRVNHAANENNVVNALVCFSRTASKRGGRNATRGVSKPRTVITAVIRFPRGSHNRIKLNTTGSHDHICKHTSPMNTWNVWEERGRRVRGPSAHRSRCMEAFRVKNSPARRINVGFVGQKSVYVQSEDFLDISLMFNLFFLFTRSRGHGRQRRGSPQTKSKPPGATWSYGRHPPTTTSDGDWGSGTPR